MSAAARAVTSSPGGDEQPACAVLDGVARPRRRRWPPPRRRWPSPRAGRSAGRPGRPCCPRRSAPRRRRPAGTPPAARRGCACRRARRASRQVVLGDERGAAAAPAARCRRRAGWPGRAGSRAKARDEHVEPLLLDEAAHRQHARASPRPDRGSVPRGARVRRGPTCRRRAGRGRGVKRSTSTPCGTSHGSGAGGAQLVGRRAVAREHAARPSRPGAAISARRTLRMSSACALKP